jgi:hypothetical protein
VGDTDLTGVFLRTLEPFGVYDFTWENALPFPSPALNKDRKIEAKTINANVTRCKNGKWPNYGNCLASIPRLTVFLLFEPRWLK